MHVADGEADRHRALRLYSLLDLVCLGQVEDFGEVQPSGFPESDGLVEFQEVGASHQVIDAADTQAGHVFPRLPGDHGEELDHVFRPAHEEPP